MPCSCKLVDFGLSKHKGQDLFYMPGHVWGLYEVLELLANVAKTPDLSSLTDETGKQL